MKLWKPYNTFTCVRLCECVRGGYMCSYLRAWVRVFVFVCVFGGNDSWGQMSNYTAIPLD